jgi:hypothetical protein
MFLAAAVATNTAVVGMRAGVLFPFSHSFFRYSPVSVAWNWFCSKPHRSDDINVGRRLRRSRPVAVSKGVAHEGISHVFVDATHVIAAGITAATIVATVTSDGGSSVGTRDTSASAHNAHFGFENAGQSESI